MNKVIVCAIIIVLAIVMSGCASMNNGVWNADLGGVHYKW